MKMAVLVPSYGLTDDRAKKIVGDLIDKHGLRYLSVNDVKEVGCVDEIIVTLRLVKKKEVEDENEN